MHQNDCACIVYVVDNGFSYNQVFLKLSGEFVLVIPFSLALGKGRGSSLCEYQNSSCIKLIKRSELPLISRGNRSEIVCNANGSYEF